MPIQICSSCFQFDMWSLSFLLLYLACFQDFLPWFFLSSCPLTNYLISMGILNEIDTSKIKSKSIQMSVVLYLSPKIFKVVQCHFRMWSKSHGLHFDSRVFQLSTAWWQLLLAYILLLISALAFSGHFSNILSLVISLPSDIFLTVLLCHAFTWTNST